MGVWFVGSLCVPKACVSPYLQIKEIQTPGISWNGLVTIIRAFQPQWSAIYSWSYFVLFLSAYI